MPKVSIVPIIQIVPQLSYKLHPVDFGHTSKHGVNKFLYKYMYYQKHCGILNKHLGQHIQAKKIQKVKEKNESKPIKDTLYLAVNFAK